MTDSICNFTFKYIKQEIHLKNLKKWYKLKKSQILFRLGNLKNFDRLIGHIKMDSKNILTKRDTCHISFKSIIWSLPYLLTVVKLYRAVECVGSFLRNFQKGGEGTI